MGLLSLARRAATSWGLCGCLLVVGEAVLICAIILRVGYTEIDWMTYMQQIQMVREGERKYSAIRGDQGPIVYPAGFVWLYAGLSSLTSKGLLIRRAQALFGALYVVDAAVMARIYQRVFSGGRFPAVLICLTALSRRSHSVYALRLFNDGPCAALTHLAVLLLLESWESAACVAFSLAVSVKMSALLYAPAWYLVLAARGGHRGAIRGVVVCAITQGLVGLPFLLHAPVDYVKSAFNLGRGFKHYWSVNLKWVPCSPIATVTDLADCEGVFASTALKIGLLALHLALLLALFRSRWLRDRGGLVGFALSPASKGAFRREEAATMLFAANFIGIACARSLHFQFCVWYSSTLPLLLWSTSLRPSLKIAVLIAIEASWNPWAGSETSSVESSALLTLGHLALLCALFFPASSPTSLAEKKML